LLSSFVQEDPTEAMYSYEIRCMSMHLKGGKVFPRELTDEEKAESEASKNKKPGAPPGKDDKNKKPEEVVSPEEKERIERETAMREEKHAAFAKWWEEQSEQDRFQLYCEDKYREPRIHFPPGGAGSNAMSSSPEPASPRSSQESTVEIVLSGADL
jgi:hypothetical protein